MVTGNEKVKQPVRCMRCGRIFEVELPHSPKIVTVEGQYIMGCDYFYEEFKGQYGRIVHGRVFPRCANSACDAGVYEFGWSSVS